MPSFTWPLKDTTDTSIAMAFLEHTEGTVRYVEDLKCWVVWDSSIWVRDEGKSHVQGKLLRALEDLIAEARTDLKSAAGEDEKKRSAKVLGAIVNCKNAHKTLAVLSQASRFHKYTIQSKDLDSYRNLITVENGTIDLKTKTLRPHRPGDFITKMLDLKYDPTAPRPVFDSFLLDCVKYDTSYADFLRVAAGYTLTGEVSAEKMFFIYGMGSNGKSRFVGSMRDVMGSYATPVPNNLFSDTRNSSNFHVAPLRGARMAVAAEISGKYGFAEDQLKRLTSDEDVSAEEKNKPVFIMSPTHKTWMFSNHKPTVKGQDEGIWRRILLLPFNNVVPAGSRDTNLRTKLEKEREGILAWMVEGAFEWYANPSIFDHPPLVVAKATREYRKDNDILGEFLDECTNSKPGSSVSSGDLHWAYKNWCISNGFIPVDVKKFKNQMEERGEKFGRFKNNNGWYDREFTKMGHTLSANNPKSK